MKKLLYISLYILFIFFFTIISFEILIRFHPIYEKFGWKNKIPLFDRIEILKKHKSEDINNIIIGDSLVEYMINQDENFLELTKTKLESKNIYQEFHNFGFAGTGPRHYLMILNLLVKNKVDIDKIYIFIDNSTDFSDYFFDIESGKNYTSSWVMPNDINLDHENINLKNLIKKLVSINIFYRYVLKQYFKFDYGSSFNNNLSNLISIFDLSSDTVTERIASLDKEILNFTNSDIINSFWAAGGIAFPEMKMYEKYGYPLHSDKINELILKDFNQINKICYVNKIDCSVVFIPDQTFVDKKYHKFYLDLGYKIDENFLNGSSYYEDLIISNFQNNNLKFYQLHGHLNSNKNMYLFLDNHFNYHGNEIMSDLFTKILINKNL